MATNQLTEKTTRPFSDAFFSALVAAISAASGSPWLVAAVPDAESTADKSEPVRMNLSLQGSLQGEFMLEFRRTEAVMLAAKCLGASADAFGTEQSEPLRRVVTVRTVEFPPAVAEEYGTFTPKASLASGPAADRANAAEVTAG